MWKGGEVIGVEEFSRDGCGGIGQGWMWRGEAGMGVEGLSSYRCGGVEQG